MSLSDHELVEMGYSTESLPLQVNTKFTRAVQDYNDTGHRQDAGDMQFEINISFFNRLDLFVHTWYFTKFSLRKPYWAWSKHLVNAGVWKLQFLFGYQKF